MLVCAVLTYGGVSLFVVVFAVYPFAAELFRAGDIPKRLIPGTIALGAFTFTMDSLPGTPQIQNIIPTTYFKTTTGAAPILGIDRRDVHPRLSAWPISNGSKRSAPRQRARATAKATSTSRRRSTRPIWLRRGSPSCRWSWCSGSTSRSAASHACLNGIIDWAYGSTYDLKLAMDHAIPTPVAADRGDLGGRGRAARGHPHGVVFGFRAVMPRISPRAARRRWPARCSRR